MVSMIRSDAPRGATVESVTKLTCLTLDRETFINMLGPLEQLMQREKSVAVVTQRLQKLLTKGGPARVPAEVVIRRKRRGALKLDLPDSAVSEYCSLAVICVPGGLRSRFVETNKHGQDLSDSLLFLSCRVKRPASPCCRWGRLGDRACARPPGRGSGAEENWRR